MAVHPLVNVVLLGFIFLLVMISHGTLEMFASKFYSARDPGLGSNLFMIDNAAFGVASFFAPAVVNRIGAKASLCLGALSFVGIVGVGLAFTLTSYAPWLVCFGGGFTGAGSSLLWTAQGMLLLSYTTPKTRGLYYAINYAISEMASITGGLLAWLYFTEHGEMASNVTLYFVFCGMLVLGALLCLVLGQPPAIPKKEFVWRTEIKETFRLFFADRRMLLLGPFFFYFGLCWPYEQIGFTRFLDKAATGFNQIIFYASCIFFSFVLGRMFDVLTPNRVRWFAVIGEVVSTLVAWAFATYLEVPYAWHATPPEISLSDKSIWLEIVTYIIFGVSFAFNATYGFWIIGALFDGPAERARAYGFNNFASAISSSIGFAISPPNRVPPLAQVIMNACFVVFACVMAAFVAPPRAPIKTIDVDARVTEPLLSVNQSEK